MSSIDILYLLISFSKDSHYLILFLITFSNSARFLKYSWSNFDNWSFHSRYSWSLIFCSVSICFFKFSISILNATLSFSKFRCNFWNYSSLAFNFFSKSIFSFIKSKFWDSNCEVNLTILLSDNSNSLFKPFISIFSVSPNWSFSYINILFIFVSWSILYCYSSSLMINFCLLASNSFFNCKISVFNYSFSQNNLLIVVSNSITLFFNTSFSENVWFF